MFPKLCRIYFKFPSKRRRQLQFIPPGNYPVTISKVICHKDGTATAYLELLKDDGHGITITKDHKMHLNS